MLSLVNRDRSRAGVAPLADDPHARAFARDVARRLIAEGFGHVAADGSKPYQRWALRGVAGHVRENLFRQRAYGVRSYMVFDPAAAHARLMRSPGHRVTILDPALTGLGVAVVWDRERNTIYAVEEFVVRRLEADPGSRELTPGEGRLVEGRVLEPAAFRPAGAALHREPAKDSAEARRAARADSYREGGGEPALALGRAAFAHDPASGEFRLSWTVPARLAPGDYTLFLFLEPVEADARDGERAAPFLAASLTYEVRA